MTGESVETKFEVAMLPDPDQRSVPNWLLDRITPGIGSLVVYSAFAEEALIDWFNLVAFDYEAKRLPVVPPRMLSKKIEKMRKLLAANAMFAELRDECVDAMAELEAACVIRNDFAHGVLTHYTDQPVRMIYIRRLDYDTKQEKMGEAYTAVALSDLDALAETMPRLAFRMKKLVVDMIAIRERQEAR